MNDFREELAWAAGFFDGEGYIGHLAARGRYAHIRLSVGQTNAQMLRRFQRAVWDLGRVTGPTCLPNRKPFWTLNICGFEACQATVAALWPWLSQPKRQQAERALKAQRQYAKTVQPYVRKL